MTDAITNRINRIKAGNDPQCLGRMQTGYAILSNQQPLAGCCMLLPDLPKELLTDSGCGPTPAHLNDLPSAARTAFLSDVATLGDAVIAATGCERLNYLMLCNQVPVLHAHVVPRFTDEDPEKRMMDPFAAYDFAGARRADALGEDEALFARLKKALGL
ncbi:MAG: hypothetical protein H6810_08990 [Phycisphaeraceae bacterium]|nr:MAG: hypothetical protein H6810_08990 [Phycisphaeraceae bacterium]